MRKGSGVSIRLDIDDVLEKLEAMKEDDFVTVELTIDSDGYSTEIELCALGIDEEENISYGRLEDLGEELI